MPWYYNMIQQGAPPALPHLRCARDAAATQGHPPLDTLRRRCERRPKFITEIHANLVFQTCISFWGGVVSQGYLNAGFDLVLRRVSRFRGVSDKSGAVAQFCFGVWSKMVQTTILVKIALFRTGFQHSQDKIRRRTKEEDKRATTNVQHRFVLLFLLYFLLLFCSHWAKALCFEGESPGGKFLKKSGKCVEKCENFWSDLAL